MGKAPMANSRLTILLSGMLAGDPYQGGATWAVLQYLLGLRRLGHDVYFVEPVAEAAIRPAGAGFDGSENAAYFRRVAEQFGLTGRSALLLEGTRQTVGLDYLSLRDVARRADLLLNISGMLTDEDLIGRIGRRAYLDLDPVFNQLWHTTQGIDMRFDRHTHWVTIGVGMGRPACRIPTCGLPWITTLQPVVLEYWRADRRPTRNALTTIANWRGYGSIEHDGVVYGQKAHSLRPLIDLPTLTAQPIVLALSIHPDETNDLRALKEHGWILVDPRRVAGTPTAYQGFIQRSWAELGIAKSGYVAARSGWFSDRSVCYLASGRPVVAQETGFSTFLPTGEGLFSFKTASDVLEAIDALRHDYERHARAARGIAEQHFDSDTVLNRLLAELGAAA
jgi:hypothetical protein